MARGRKWISGLLLRPRVKLWRRGGNEGEGRESWKLAYRRVEILADMIAGDKGRDRLFENDPGQVETWLIVATKRVKKRPITIHPDLLSGLFVCTYTFHDTSIVPIVPVSLEDNFPPPDFPLWKFIFMGTHHYCCKQLYRDYVEKCKMFIGWSLMTCQKWEDYGEISWWILLSITLKERCIFMGKEKYKWIIGNSKRWNIFCTLGRWIL